MPNDSDRLFTRIAIQKNYVSPAQVQEAQSYLERLKLAVPLSIGVMLQKLGHLSYQQIEVVRREMEAFTFTCPQCGGKGHRLEVIETAPVCEKCRGGETALAPAAAEEGASGSGPGSGAGVGGGPGARASGRGAPPPGAADRRERERTDSPRPPDRASPGPGAAGKAPESAAAKRAKRAAEYAGMMGGGDEAGGAGGPGGAGPGVGAPVARPAERPSGRGGQPAAGRPGERPPGGRDRPPVEAPAPPARARDPFAGAEANGRGQPPAARGPAAPPPPARPSGLGAGGAGPGGRAGGKGGADLLDEVPLPNAQTESFERWSDRFGPGRPREGAGEAKKPAPGGPPGGGGGAEPAGPKAESGWDVLNPSVIADRVALQRTTGGPAAAGAEKEPQSGWELLNASAVREKSGWDVLNPSAVELPRIDLGESEKAARPAAPARGESGKAPAPPPKAAPAPAPARGAPGGRGRRDGFLDEAPPVETGKFDAIRLDAPSAPFESPAVLEAPRRVPAPPRPRGEEADEDASPAGAGGAPSPAARPAGDPRDRDVLASAFTELVLKPEPPSRERRGEPAPRPSFTDARTEAMDVSPAAGPGPAKAAPEPPRPAARPRPEPVPTPGEASVGSAPTQSLEPSPPDRDAATVDLSASQFIGGLKAEGRGPKGAVEPPAAAGRTADREAAPAAPVGDTLVASGPEGPGAGVTAAAPVEEGDSGAGATARAAPDAGAGGPPRARTAPTGFASGAPRPPNEAASEAPVAEDPFKGKVVGGCRIEKLVGRGGMGTVYRAKHLELERDVALKILAPALTADPKQVAQFFREARALARLDHNNIVTIYNVGKEEEIHFIVMQLVEGGSLERLVRSEGRLSVERGTSFALQAAKGLLEAHTKGIVHRDVKPENMLVASGDCVKLTDFGLARMEDNAGFSFASGRIVGTPYYMSPEQIDGRDVDLRTDIYALGATYYYLLTGERPFQGETPVEILLKHVNEQIIPARDKRREIPESLSRIVSKMLVKDPDQRYGSMRDVIRDIEAAVAGKAVTVELPKAPSAVFAPVAGAPAEGAAEAGAAGGGEATKPEELAPLAPTRVAIPSVTRSRSFLALAALLLVALPLTFILGWVTLSRISAELATPLAASAAELDAERALALARELEKPGNDHEAISAYEAVARIHPNTQAAEQARGAAGRLKQGLVERAKRDVEDRVRRARAEAEGDRFAAAFALLSPTRELAELGVEKPLGEEARDLRLKLAARGLAFVPAGAFRAGPDTRAETTGAFYIDLREVSRADWKQLLGDLPEAVRPGPDDLPVTGITFDEAKRYAERAGRRLPTALQWEKAARGLDGREWPWGAAGQAERANCREARRGALVPVGFVPPGFSTPDDFASPYGCLHMAGNAAEWVIGPDGGPMLAGGSFESALVNTKTYSIARPLESRFEARNHAVGFRCVRSAE